MLQFSDNDTDSEADYTSIVEQSLTFTTVNRIENLNVQIIADSFTELNETFSAILSSVSLTTGGDAINISDQERARLMISQNVTNVIIQDDDSKL